MKLIIADSMALPGIDYLMVSQSREPVLLGMPNAPQHILSTYDRASYLHLDPRKWQSIEAFGRQIDAEGLVFSQVFVDLSSTFCRFVVALFQGRSAAYEQLYVIDSPLVSDDKRLLAQLERCQLVTATAYEPLKETLCQLIASYDAKTVLCLHGLGQGSQAWDQVIAGLDGVEGFAVDLFDDGRLPKHFSDLTARVEQVLAQIKAPLILVGLSLGAMLSLSLLSHPKVAGAVAIAPQYRFRANRAYQLQSFLFKLIPSWFFKKQGLDKANLMAFYRGLADFDLTQEMKACTKPVLLLCGDRDRINHKTSQELVGLLKNSCFKVISGSGHEMTKDQPDLLAQAIQSFLKEY